jgi:CspA family cold shock protein
VLTKRGKIDGRTSTHPSARLSRTRVFPLPAVLSELYYLVTVQWRSDVPSGTVKSFDAAKGYGFIMPDGGGEDVYVHASVVEKAGLKQLHSGTKVTFDLALNHHGKPVASAGEVRTARDRRFPRHQRRGDIEPRPSGRSAQGQMIDR